MSKQDETPEGRAKRIAELEAAMTPRQRELAKLLADLLVADYKKNPPKE